LWRAGCEDWGYGLPLGAFERDRHEAQE
jgi:hypothetical protein